jgi:hypothetical protein
MMAIAAILRRSPSPTRESDMQCDRCHFASIAIPHPRVNGGLIEKVHLRGLKPIPSLL